MIVTENRRPHYAGTDLRPAAPAGLVSANDFVRELAVLGKQLGMRASVVGARPVFATAARFPAADEGGRRLARTATCAGRSVPDGA